MAAAGVAVGGTAVSSRVGMTIVGEETGGTVGLGSAVWPAGWLTVAAASTTGLGGTSSCPPQAAKSSTAAMITKIEIPLTTLFITNLILWGSTMWLFKERLTHAFTPAYYFNSECHAFIGKDASFFVISLVDELQSEKLASLL